MTDKNEHVQRLFFKAENDLRSAVALIRTDKPATDVICFHCQQAAEKILKAWLHWHEISSPRTHNLAELLEVCKRINPAFEQLDEVEVLTPYAVELRYAEDFYLPPMEETQEALKMTEKVQAFVRLRFEELGVNPIRDFLEES